MKIHGAVMRPKDEDGMANYADPEQTFPIGAVCSGSAQLTKTHLSQYS